MFDPYSPPLVDSTFKPLRAGINPAPTGEAEVKYIIAELCGDKPHSRQAKVRKSFDIAEQM
jgi:hypothetical protein